MSKFDWLYVIWGLLSVVYLILDAYKINRYIKIINTQAAEVEKLTARIKELTGE